MAKLNLKVAKRTVSGRQVKKLRQEGFLPANVFGHGVDSLSIQVKAKEFAPIFDEAGETQVIYLQVETEKDPRPVLVSDIQYDPVTDQPLHVDFHQVNLKEKVTANVPFEIIGESPAVKDLGANIISMFSELEVEALPTDLPEKITADVSQLVAIGDVIKVSDLKVDRSKVELTEDPETVLVTVVEQQAEEVAPAPVTPAETETATPKAEASETPKAE